MGDLALHSTQVGQRTVLAASGEIDLITSPRLEAAAEEALDGGALELWIDLADVEFIDSTGIHTLLTVRGRAAELHRRFAVICPISPIRRAFELTGVDEAMPLFTSRDEAHRHG